MVTTNTNIATKEVRLYEGSYLFASIKTDLNITEDFIQMKLAKQYEYTLTKDCLWADILENGILKNRYSFTYENGLTTIK